MPATRLPLELRGPSARGFTVIELLAAVAIVGILAALAIFTVRKQIRAAYTGEPKAVIQGIRGAQEVYRQENLAYASCSSTLGGDYYPHDAPDDKKWSFSKPSPSTPKDLCWARLNVKTDSGVRYVYAVVGGAGNDAFPTVPDLTTQPTWPTADGGGDPWYVVHAAGDLDLDGERSTFWSSSFSREVGAEHEEE